MKKAILVLFAFLLSPVANAYCFSPSFYVTPPDEPGTWHKPTPPICMTGYKYSGTHTCSEWEIENYVTDLEDYLRKLSEYKDELNTFADEVVNFLDEAYQYADCETRETLETIK